MTLILPARVTWPVYLRFMAAGLFSMFLGSQTAHALYRPLDDTPDVVNQYREMKWMALKEERKNVQNKTKNDS